MSPSALFTRLRQQPDLVQNGVMAGVLSVLVVVELLTSERSRGPLALDLAGVLALTVPLAWRRRHPFAVVLVLGVAAVCDEAWLGRVSGGAVPIVCLMIGAYSAGRHLPTGEAVGALAVVIATVVAVSALDTGLADFWFPAVFFGWSPWLTGRILRARTMLARELEERALRLEADRDEAARRAVADERNRIARELHDVVAHSLSVMVVQAGAGRRRARTDPARAAECAELIERVGREAMGEMRRLLGVIGRPAEAPLAPLPGLDRLGELVERARAAGLPVELHRRGEAVELPAGVDVAAYRIVQEALTNALKHAGPAHVRVDISYASAALEVEVVDDGRGPVDADGGGHGLVGMRERAVVCGGKVSAGRARGGGFRVHARFPLQTGREAAIA